ncbi:hypothetical protein BGX38DRAFT_1276319 [Terfezia claveryi]|nr:hypothetical protein BGX38DRAFT_1276319 [Terfezia claveryi]
MPTNTLSEKLFKAELIQFLQEYNFVHYDDTTPGTRWCILKSSRIELKMFQNLVNLIVQEWMRQGITKMTQFETRKGMKLREVVVMVREHVEKHLRAMEEAVGSSKISQ